MRAALPCASGIHEPMLHAPDMPLREFPLKQRDPAVDALIAIAAFLAESGQPDGDGMRDRLAAVRTGHRRFQFHSCQHLKHPFGGGVVTS